MYTRRLTSSTFSSTQQIKEFYDQKYAKETLKRHRFLDRLFILSIMSKYKVPRSALVLDVGCGTGWYTYLLASSGLRVVGVDISRTAILRAKKHGNRKNIYWIVSDACNLPVNNNFDVAFCSDFSLFNVPDLETCTSLARKLFECLKPKGLFVFRESSNLSEVSTTMANHSLRQVYSFFANLKFVKDVEIYAVNVQLFLFFGEKALTSIFTKLTSALLKIHKKSCRIICVSTKF